MRIRVELSCTPGYPDGNAADGYEFVLPLNEKGHVLASQWRRQQNLCTVRRFLDGAAGRQGLVRHVGQGWQFDYDPKSEDDNEPLLKLDTHPLAVGNHISLTRGDGVLQCRLEPGHSSQDCIIGDHAHLPDFFPFSSRAAPPP